MTTNAAQSLEPAGADDSVIGSTVVVNSLAPDTEYVNTQGVRFTTHTAGNIAG